MKKFRRKYFRGLCPSCNDIEKLKLIETYDELGTVEMKCLECARKHTYPVERVRRTGRVLSKDQFKKFKKAMSKILKYSPRETYFIGQKIHHPSFDEVGKVLKKDKTEGDIKVIVVKFEKSGKKKLVEEYN